MHCPGEPLRPDTWQINRQAGGILDAPASYSGGILGGIHWRATLAFSGGCCGGSRSGGLRGGIQASRSGRILGGIHWRAALAGYSAGSTGQLRWLGGMREAFEKSNGLKTRLAN